MPFARLNLACGITNWLRHLNPPLDRSKICLIWHDRSTGSANQSDAPTQKQLFKG